MCSLYRGFSKSKAIEEWGSSYALNITSKSLSTNSLSRAFCTIVVQSLCLSRLSYWIWSPYMFLLYLSLNRLRLNVYIFNERRLYYFFYNGTPFFINMYPFYMPGFYLGWLVIFYRWTVTLLKWINSFIEGYC